jgi:hypothetical protein
LQPRHRRHQWHLLLLLLMPAFLFCLSCLSLTFWPSSAWTPLHRQLLRHHRLISASGQTHRHLLLVQLPLLLPKKNQIIVNLQNKNKNEDEGVVMRKGRSA